jgi:glycerol-3-phosphate dehydrogenase
VQAVLSSLDRAATLERFERERFDLAVIGGGIAGAGIAREAALRGLSVALLEADDYASGTSSRSSKLIHGGLRYLAQGEVALVRETALERVRIQRLAPHLAESRWMLVPTRSRASLLKFRAGIGVYERLGDVAEPDRHRVWSGDELAQEEPLLDSARTPWACAYREYLTDDAHLVLANLRAAAGGGAALLNHAPVSGIVLEASRATGVEARCALTQRRVRVNARGVINAAGPWVDAVRRLEAQDADVRLHLSKGVHVVLPAERLPLRHLLILQARDGRSIFAIRRDECVYVGTTDTTWPGGETHWPGIEPDDVLYLLEPLARALRGAPPTPDDVVAAWAGLRPLVAEAGKAATEVSRRDEVWIGPGGVVSVAGGKLTGYRPMARRALERAAQTCGLALAPAPVEDPPLPGGDFSGSLDALVSRLARETGLSAQTAARLARLHGAEAFEIAARDGAALVAGQPLLRAEVDFAVEREGALRLEDLLYRRLCSALYVPASRETAVAAAAAQMATRLGWSDAQREAEVSRVRARLSEDLGFQTSARAGTGTHEGVR